MRAICHATAWAGLVVTSGCYHDVPISTDELRARPSSTVTAVLEDGTTVVFADAHIDGDALLGQVQSCRDSSGPDGLCDDLRRIGRVPLKWVQSLRVEKFDGVATTVVVVLVVGVAVATVYAIAAAGLSHMGGAGLSSCPLVYSFDGAGYRLDSGTFGGSFFSAAQRTDHDLLEFLAPTGGELRLRVTNELDESEHIDALALDVVDYPRGSWVVPDASGRLLTFSDPVAPIAARDLRGEDALRQVARKDDVYWRSDVWDRSPENPSDARDGLELEFPRPPGAKVAKIRLSAMNTPWSVTMLLEFLARRGRDLPAWYDRMNTDPDARKKLAEFMVREGMLEVSVWSPSGWSRRGVFWEAGPEVRKDQALAISIDDVAGDRLRVRLESPVAFWTIDSVHADYSEEVPLQVRRLPFRSAVARDGRDLRGALETADGARYSTERGDSAEIVFDSPPAPESGKERSYVLTTTGYYTPHVVPDLDADPRALDAMMAMPGEASRQALIQLNASLLREVLP